MFVLSKILGLLTDPLALGQLLVMAGTALWLARWRRLGGALVAVAAAGFFLGAVLPLESWLLRPLEDRFPPPDPMPARVDGIIVLGGIINPALTAARGQPAVTGTVERLTAMIALARHYPQARLVFTGGTGDMLTQELKEAPLVAGFLASIGFDPGRVLFESQSRNTHENATLTRSLVDPRPGETWLLVTSASHMPRSMGVFRAAGWPVVAYPVDFTTAGGERNGFPGFSLNGLGRARQAIYEWRGLIYYRLRGWTPTLFPAPAEAL